MSLKLYLIYLIVLLLTTSLGYGTCQSSIVKLSPGNPWYWLDSTVVLMCKTSSNATIQECNWFINDKLISTNELLYRQFLIDMNQKECVIKVAAAVAESGIWECRIFLSTAAKDKPELQSTFVNILTFSYRECIVIVSCSFVMLKLTITAILFRTGRGLRLIKRTSYFTASAPVILGEENFNSTGTLPPSYDTVVCDGAILVDEFDQSQLSRFHNEMNGHYFAENQLEDTESAIPKTRSAPNLI